MVKNLSALDTPHAAAVVTLLFGTVLCALIGGLLFDEPRSGTVWAMAPLMCATGAITCPTPRERMFALGINIMQTAVFQYIAAALEPLKFLQFPALYLILITASLRERAVNSCVVIESVVSSMGHADAVGGFDNLVFLLLSLPVFMPGYYVLDRLLLRSWHGIETYPPLTGNQLFRRMMAFTTALALYYALDLSFGSWIVLTVGLSYMRGASGFRAQTTAGMRFLIGVPVLLLGITYMSSLCAAFYAVSYLTVAWGVISYFLSYRTGQYLLFNLPYVMMLCSTRNLAYGTSPVFGNGWNYFFESFLAIGLGSLCVVFWEMRSAAETGSSSASAPKYRSAQ